MNQLNGRCRCYLAHLQRMVLFKRNSEVGDDGAVQCAQAQEYLKSQVPAKEKTAPSSTVFRCFLSISPFEVPSVCSLPDGTRREAQAAARCLASTLG